MEDVGVVHIDKLRVIGPCRHNPVGKTWYSVNQDDEMLPIASSPEKYSLGDDFGEVLLQSKGIQVDGTATELLIQCCPPLVLQRHNWTGHSSVLSYTVAIFERFTEMLGIDVAPTDLKAWKRGKVRLTEVHLTANFRCPPRQVKKVIDVIDANARSGKHRDADGVISLGWTPKRRSKYHVLSLYDKWDELKQRFGNPPESSIRNRLLTEAKDSIRAELKLFSQFLARNDLNRVSSWSAVDVDALYFKLLNGYGISGVAHRMLTDDEMATLTVAEERVYRLWLHGEDLYDLFKSRTSVAKHVSAIKEKTGINVGGRRRPQALPGVDLSELFSPTNALAPPDWLIQEPNFFFRPETSHSRPLA